MLARKVTCLKCPRGTPRYITYSDTWYCANPIDFRDFTLLRDSFPMLGAQKWCPLVKKGTYYDTKRTKKSSPGNAGCSRW